jgi:hypothetical protein
MNKKFVYQVGNNKKAFNGLPPHNVTPLPPWQQSGCSYVGTQFADHLVPEPSGCKTAEAAQETATLCH